MKKKSKLQATGKEEWMEIHSLRQRLAHTAAPEEKDIQRYRELVLAHPEVFKLLCGTSEHLRKKLLERIADGYSRAFLLSEEDALKRDMGYSMAAPLERLLIDQILTARLHVLHAERLFSEKITSSVTLTEINYWQDFLAGAQRRYLRSIETLARVRRLARNGPLFQVNIANVGSPPPRCQGELFGKTIETN